MDQLLLIKAAILGVVEGLTEFLPISSTGHLILAGALLHFGDAIGSAKAATFDISIQTGAMLAVIWQYRQKIIDTIVRASSEASARRFAINVIVAFMPAAVIGLAIGGLIKDHLFTPTVVASAFIVGGLVILWVERSIAKSVTPPRIASVDQMSWIDALKIGLAQCLAMIPGTSRSGATIIGGMLFGFSRKAATEFSFYLAIPTLVAAGGYSVFKQRHNLDGGDLPLFTVGFVFSFIFALLCIRWLIRYVSQHDFKPFAWYRIAFGVLVLGVYGSGLLTWVAE
jgi:undecaprenyl-diphosphatase